MIPKELRTDNLPAVQPFDPDKYLGKWYEIARLPHSFEEGLEQVTATYTRDEDGDIIVLNRGFDTEDREWSEAEGSAWIPDLQQPALLKVSFFWPFAADYKIIMLDQKSYAYALVTSSSKEYLWLLSRTPQMETVIRDSLLGKAKAMGFKTELLHFVEHD
jgi:apolipoprotein D and lipocalin family protein